MPESRSVVISIVSHNHAKLVASLLGDIERYCSDKSISVVLTLNVPEELPFSEGDFSFPMEVIRNQLPRGFGANHNAAFRKAGGEFFCVLNPDIRLNQDPFPRLLEILKEEHGGVVAPLVLNKEGGVEDSFRRLPTPVGVLLKALGLKRGADYEVGREPLRPDWVAGMFMMFPSALFGRLGGFDGNYFLYYEDVELCTRLRLAGYEVVLDPLVAVVHEARRESHRDLDYFRWHLRSMLRFFSSSTFLSGLQCKLAGKL